MNQNYSADHLISLHQQLCETLHDMYISKNTDYGDSVHDTYLKLGAVSIVTRLWDKLNRVTTLSSHNDAKVQDEKLEDTLMDLANYALLYMIELKRDYLSRTNPNSVITNDLPNNGTTSPRPPIIVKDVKEEYGEHTNI